MLALAEPDTIDVLEQVGPIPWADELDNVHDHFLDHVVLKADGRRIGLTDKPYAQVTKAFGEEIVQVSREGRAGGQIDHLYLVTEYGRDPVKLYNAELMRGCRDADTDADTDARAVVAEMMRDATLKELTQLIGMGPRGFRALVRLIGSGELTLLQEEKISKDTQVTRGDGRYD